MIGRIAVAATLVAFTMQVATAQQTTITIRALANPYGDAKSLAVDGPFGATDLATSIPEEGVIATITSDTLAPQTRNVLIRWDDDSATDFAILVAPSFAGSNIEVRFEKVELSQPPTPDDLRSQCGSGLPGGGLAGIFKMFYRCRAYALSLELDGRWDPPHRQAVQGWLVANYALLTRATPVSPYGADPVLVERLQEVLRRVADINRQAPEWTPLILADAKQLLDLISAQDIRFAGTVPAFVEQGRYLEAFEVNARALEALGNAEADQRAQYIEDYRITPQVLEDNEEFIKTLGGHQLAMELGL